MSNDAMVHFGLILCCLSFHWRLCIATRHIEALEGDAARRQTTQCESAS